MRFGQQGQGFNAQPLGYSFNALKRGISLASLYPTHIGAVHLQALGKSLLAYSVSAPVLAEISSEHSLKIACCHWVTIVGSLLIGLQTYE